VYVVELSLIYDGVTGADIQIAFTVPASATLVNTFISGLTSAAALTTDDFVSAGTTNPSLGTLGTGTNVGMQAKYLLTTSSTSGNLQLQWAQATINGTATRVFAGSYLIAQRVG